MPKKLRWLALVLILMLAAWWLARHASDRVQHSPRGRQSAAVQPTKRPAPATANHGGEVQCLPLRSATLRRTVNICVLLPPAYAQHPRQRYPVLYFLPGLGGSAEELVSSGVWELVDDLWRDKRLRPFLIVTPDSFNSFYINAFDGRLNYENFFMHELLGWTAHHYRTLPGRSNRALLGISMGGYGALHLAFKYPRSFGSVSAHSAMLLRRPPIQAVKDRLAAERLRQLGRIFGMPPDPLFWRRNSPFTLARSRRHLAGLRIEFDCGEQDGFGFERGALGLNRLLTRLGVPHEFHLYPGGHSWRYFASRLPAALEFAAQKFGH